MKKVVIFLTALAMIAGFSTLSFAASIQGSKHDLSTAGLGTTELCVFCHVPHNPTSPDAPLWNHAVTSQNFTLYDSSTSTATGHISGLCLSCHDGQTFINAFGSNTGDTTIETFSPGTSANLTTDLTDDHPVMMSYPSDWATTQKFNDPGTLSFAEVYGGTNDVECASCHNPHDPNGGGAGSTKFLRASNDGSQICLDCHNK